MNREELAYAGGLFEGEGYFFGESVRLRSGAVSVRATAGVAMTDREPLERLAAAVGFGPIYGPYQEKGEYAYKRPRKPIYAWRVTTFEQTQAVVAMLWPWLGPRRRARAVEVLGADTRQPRRRKKAAA